MNRFTKKTNPSEDGAVTGRTGTPWVAGLILKMGVMMIIIAAAFIARVIEIRTFIAEFRIVGKHQKSVRKPFTDIELFIVFR